MTKFCRNLRPPFFSLCLASLVHIPVCRCKSWVFITMGGNDLIVYRSMSSGVCLVCGFENTHTHIVLHTPTPWQYMCDLPHLRLISLQGRGLGVWLCVKDRQTDGWARERETWRESISASVSRPSLMMNEATVHAFHCTTETADYMTKKIQCSESACLCGYWVFHISPSPSISSLHDTSFAWYVSSGLLCRFSLSAGGHTVQLIIWLPYCQFNIHFSLKNGFFYFRVWKNVPFNQPGMEKHPRKLPEAVLTLRFFYRSEWIYSGCTFQWTVYTCMCSEILVVQFTI